MSLTVLPPSHDSLSGRRFWVVSGAGPLGAALADELRSRGSRVAVSPLRGDTSVGAPGGDHVPVGVDLADADEVARATHAVRESLGGLDGLVVAAGGGRRRAAAPDAVDAVGLGNLLAAVLPDLVRQREGYVVGVVAGARRVREATASSAAVVAQLAVLAAMRAALGAKDVHVTTAISRSFGSRTRRPFGIDTSAACRWIVDAVADGRAEVVIPRSGTLVRSALRDRPRRSTAPGRPRPGGDHP